MLKKQKNFYQKTTLHTTLLCIISAFFVTTNTGAAVVSRGNAVSSRPTVSTSLNQTTGRMPTVTTDNNQTVDNPQQDEETEENVSEPTIENKSSQFDTILSSSSASDKDSSADNLAELIRQQRAELDSQDAISTANAAIKLGNQNACDMGLRACMQEKCGTDFTKCSGDTDTSWGNKMDACRRDLNCTGEEYRLFASEIKSDRDMNARLASYNAVINCGNQYNDCIMTECGTTFSKCLGKSAGDAAIAKCKTIADNCKQQDSGLASRTMQVFGNLRQNAEVQVQKDEERLYELRDQMQQQCTALGAMFDERTFSCVFTVNFYAGEDSTLYASKKLYAGDVFSCTPNWFGIDVTTFMENAYRLTREQKSASSALLGAGLGVAAGAITSGAIDRAIDTKKAENALKDAKEEHEENYGTESEKESKEKEDSKSDKNDKSASDNTRPSSEELQKSCESVGGTWKNNYCSEPQCGEGKIYDDMTGKCKEDPNLSMDEQKTSCEIAGGVWSNATCLCSNGGTFNRQTGLCECGTNQKLENGKCVLNLNADLPKGLNTTTTNNNTLFNNTGLSGTRNISTRSVSSR